ncbi:hypothetical protein AMK34_11490 [Amycolatopsis sp. CB00013]|nr:hypothetical protein AMK34_11490 [Amycolatopsis sp. CB00013]
MVPMDMTVDMQRKVSMELRATEKRTQEEQEHSQKRLFAARAEFSGFVIPGAGDSAVDGEIEPISMEG